MQAAPPKGEGWAGLEEGPRAVTLSPAHTHACVPAWLRNVLAISPGFFHSAPHILLHKIENLS